MPDALEVHLNREGPHSIAVAASSFEATGDFDVVLRNHGASLHVHLRLDPDLARAATIGTVNHYVENETVRRVRVEVDEHSLPADGRLEIVTGYGAETERVPVSIAAPSDEPGVAVDERLGRPQPRTADPLLDREDVPVLVLAALALLVAVLAAVAVRDAVVVAGVVVVLLGIVAAGAFLRR